MFVHDRDDRTSVRVTEPVSGAVPDSESWDAKISGDGRHVVFSSIATNLVPGDTNGHGDVFVRDLARRRTTRVSVRDDGSQPSRPSASGVISEDGSRVAFVSHDESLVAGDTNRVGDVFVRDLVTGRTVRVSVGPDGRQTRKGGHLPGISADGRHVCFSTDPRLGGIEGYKHSPEVFAHDLATGRTVLVPFEPETSPLPDGHSGFTCALDRHGRHVAFVAMAASSVDPRYRVVVVRDRLTGHTELITRSACGNMGNLTDLSADGHVVLYGARDGSHSRICRTDLRTGRTSLVSGTWNGAPPNGHHSRPSATADGRTVVFSSTATNLFPWVADRRFSDLLLWSADDDS